MDTRFLVSLIEVVETGSIAAAARRQLLTPAAVSQRIKALEIALGTRLLIRTGHTAKPTAKCLKILPKLKAIISDVASIQMELDDSELSGELKVGAISTFLTGLMPRVISKLSKVAPKLDLQIVPGTSEQLYEKLIAHKIDAVVLVKPPFTCPKNIEQAHLYSEPLALISHTKTQLTLEDVLVEEPFIRYDRGSWGGAIADSYLVNNGIQPKLICDIDSLESITVMVKSGMGVSLMPVWQGMAEITNDLSVTRVDDDKYDRGISLLSEKRAGKEKLIQVLQTAITESVE